MLRVGVVVSCLVLCLLAPAAAAADDDAAPAEPAPYSVAEIADHGIGAMQTCEMTVLPVTIIPVVGPVASALVAWACIGPAAFTVDYLGIFHGGHGTNLWQPLVALVAGKLVHDIVLIGGVLATAGAYTLFFASFTVLDSALLVAPSDVAAQAATYVPMLTLGGLIALTGGAYFGGRWAQDAAGRFVFESGYRWLSGFVHDPKDVARAKRVTVLSPPLDPVSRAYGLLVTAWAVSPDEDLRDLLPIVGPVVTADEKAAAVGEGVRKFGREVLDEDVQHPDALSHLIGITVQTEAWLTAVAHLAFISAGLSFLTGLALAPVLYSESGAVLEYAFVGGSAVLGALYLGVVGGVAIGLAQVPRAVRGVGIPIAFGLVPPAVDVE